MEQKYNIKGIDKIISKVGKKKLAEYYQVDINADFENVIMEDFKEHGIPNGLEVAFYFSLTPEEFNNFTKEGKGLPNSQNEASRIYEQDQDKRAMFGFDYIPEKIDYDKKDISKIKSGNYGNILYFFVNEPINANNIGDYLYDPKYYVGGTHYNNLLMGKGYYSKHKEEITEEYNKVSTTTKKMDLIKQYIENFMKKFENVDCLKGYGPRGTYKETDEIQKENENAEKIILELTGKGNIDEINLGDFISLKRNLEAELKRLQKEFEDKFTQKGERE